MWIIFGCSLIGTFVFIERMLALQRSNILPAHLFQSLLKHLRAGDTDRAAALCRENTSVFGRIAETALTYRDADRAVVKEVMEEVGQVEVGHMSVRIHVLSTVAAIAPLLGLLGTVAGMIEVFNDLKGPEAAAAQAAASGPSIEALAEGIEHALYTTLGGLAIAIPFYVAFRYVETRIDRFAVELEEAGLSLLNEMIPPSPRDVTQVEQPAPTEPKSKKKKGKKAKPASEADAAETDGNDDGDEEETA